MLPGELMNRRHRNASTPLSSLPPELIAKIVKNVIDDSCKEVTEDRGISGWFKEFIKRSGKLALHVDTLSGSVRPAEYDGMFRLLTANIHRAHSLYIRLDLNRERIFWIWNLPAPQLDTLICENGRRDLQILFNSPFTSNSDLGSPNSTENLISSAKLRHLEVLDLAREDIDLLFPLCPLPTVINLTLGGLSSDIERDFIKLCCNAVRRLTIYNTTSGQPSPTTTTMTPGIVLPNLQHLYSNLPFLPDLPSLTLPSILQINIYVYAFLEGNYGIAQDFSILSTLFKSFLSDRVRANVRPQLDHFSLTFNYSGCTAIGKSASGENLVTLDIEYMTLGRDELLYDNSVTKGIVQVTQDLGTPVRSISITGRNNECFQDVFHTFRTRAEVATIHLREFSVFSRFLSFPNSGHMPCALELNTDTDVNPFAHLSPCAFVSPPSGASTCDCEGCCNKRDTSYPGLKTFIMEDIDTGTLNFNDALKLFLDWLEARAARGLKLQTLRLIETNISEELMERITPVVTNIVVE
ncbi:hypothetical protein AX16_010345 [Volvariella volvacea WC 439]|nr:hypothetical protein AX16_010345 [Volvariella volvacea WC 439]